MNDKLVGPDGSEIIKKDIKTERAKERIIEDENFVPVIIKRTDETIRHPDDVLQRIIKEGVIEFKRPLFSLFLSALAAGLILGFAAMSVALASMLVDTVGIKERFATALVYPLGFIVCIFSGTNLFTEYTANAVYPVLDKQVPTSKLLRLWPTILIGNLIGTFLSSLLLFAAEPVIMASTGYQRIAERLVGPQFQEIFVSAILAGWLMAQGGFLIRASSSKSGQIICIWIVTFIIGIGGLHHSIAGSAEAFVAAIIGHTPWREVFAFLGSSVLGNLVGGVIFVALLNFGHIRTTIGNRSN